MKIQRIVTLLCTAALLLCAASPPALAADRSAACYYPVEVESYTAGDFDQPRIRKVYQLSRSDDPAGIPTEDFEEYGRTFHLMEMTRKDEIGVDTQPLTKTVTTDNATGDLGEILKQLAPEIEAETEDGYAGVLKLDYNSVQAEVKGYKTSTRNLSASRTYPNLSDADLSLVPKTVTEGGRTLTLADVKWSDSTNMEGEDVVVRYTATASYTGSVTSRYATGYTVTADYTGEVAKTNCEIVTYTAIFGCTDVPYHETATNAPQDKRPDRGGYISGDAPCPPERPRTLYNALRTRLCRRHCRTFGRWWLERDENERKEIRHMKLRTYLKALLISSLLVTLFVSPASALEYDFDGADDYLFGKPTSQEVIHREEEDQNTNRSKTAARMPPGFGTPTSYLPNSGEYLTPNLAPGGMDGGLVNSLGNVDYTTLPSVDGSALPNLPDHSFSTSTWTGSGGVGYTDVTQDSYYTDGTLGSLHIPAIGLTAKIVQGTDSAALTKGVGHFTDTSIWNGNVCLAAHNRGTNSYFGKIHTLSIGDSITLTTKEGTRTYSVTSVEKVSETDNSGTASTSDNQITLYTCVRNEREYRWCVKGIES